jgi:energy-coupling factor transport system permease protein
VALFLLEEPFLLMGDYATLTNMNHVLAYIPAKSLIHTFDTRIKLAMLVVYSVGLFCTQNWLGLGIYAVLLFVVLLVSRIPLINYVRVLIPVLFILAFIWLCNSIPFDLDRSMSALAYAVRIMLMIVASFVVTFTSTSTQLTDAFSSILKPFRKIRVPVDDVAFTLSLALRFIPLLFEQLSSIKTAQISRAAHFSAGSILGRFKAWLTVLIPLFVSIFRRADTIAEAMDARCYGAGERSSLNAKSVAPLAWLSLCVMLLFCVTVSYFM